jgi:ABC-type transport system substrate-binding protein
MPRGLAATVARLPILPRRFQVSLPTQRTLIAQSPDGGAVPSVAASMPEVSAHGLTVTVQPRSGVRFSPPVKREVTAGDVRYAITRDSLIATGGATSTCQGSNRMPRVARARELALADPGTASMGS